VGGFCDKQSVRTSPAGRCSSTLNGRQSFRVIKVSALLGLELLSAPPRVQGAAVEDLGGEDD